MDRSRRRLIAGLAARALAVLAVALLIGVAATAAVEAHRPGPAVAPPPAASDAQYRMLGDKLRQVRELMLGTTLPPKESYCRASAPTTLRRLGLPIPKPGSPGWQIMIAHCAGSAR